MRRPVVLLALAVLSFGCNSGGSSGQNQCTAPDCPEALLVSPQTLSIGDDGTVYIADMGSIAARDAVGDGAIIAVSPDSEQRLISGRGRGNGTDFFAPTAIQVDADGSLIVASALVDVSVFRVSSARGDRELISGAARGSGPVIDFRVRDLALRSDGGTAYLVEAPPTTCCLAQPPDTRLFSIDIDSGLRELLASDAVGSGPTLEAPVSVEFSPSLDGLLVMDSSVSRFCGSCGRAVAIGSNAVVEVDLVTLERTAISANPPGTPVVLDFSLAMALATDEAIVSKLDTLISVSLPSGNREELILGAPTDTFLDLAFAGGDLLVGIVSGPDGRSLVFVDLVTLELETLDLF